MAGANKRKRPRMLFNGEPYIWRTGGEEAMVYFAGYTASIEMVIVTDQKGRRIRIPRYELWEMGE